MEPIAASILVALAGLVLASPFVAVARLTLPGRRGSRRPDACRACGYELDTPSDHPCPECGLAPNQLPDRSPSRTPWILGTLASILFLAFATLSVLSGGADLEVAFLVTLFFVPSLIGLVVIQTIAAPRHPLVSPIAGTVLPAAGYALGVAGVVAFVWIGSAQNLFGRGYDPLGVAILSFLATPAIGLAAAGIASLVAASITRNRFEARARTVAAQCPVPLPANRRGDSASPPSRPPNR